MSSLFQPLTLRGVTVRNRIGVSPMCQYSSVDGMVDDWHLVHLGARAVGGAGLVIAEATAVTPEGRITPADLGLWKDEQIDGHARLVKFIDGQGAVAGIQLAHAGRKAGRVPPWEVDPVLLYGRPLSLDEGGWIPVAPSPIAFDTGYLTPHELSAQEIAGVIAAFVDAAGRAAQAGYRWLEIHAAHGYLLHSFHSPISNKRDDAYGGSLQARCRFTRELARALRAAWPAEHVLSFRLSHTDWEEGGWQTADTVQLAAWLKEDGVDLIDVSSGGSTPKPPVPFAPGYQVPGAEAVRAQSAIPSAAVGVIFDAEQADAILREGRADMVYLGRELLRDPYWPQRAAVALQATAQARVPVQYNVAWTRTATFSNEPIGVPRVAPSKETT